MPSLHSSGLLVPRAHLSLSLRLQRSLINAVKSATNLLQQGMHADKILSIWYTNVHRHYGYWCKLLLFRSLCFYVVIKLERNRAIGRASVVPTIFGVNEPILFGAPLVLNPIFFYPIYLCTNCKTYDLSSLLKHFLAQRTHLLPNLPWTTPGPSWYCSWYKLQFLSALQHCANCGDIVIYHPFLKVYDEQIL